jgi:DDE superfamily endonuclease
MWSLVPSFEAVLQALAVVFTEPSFQTNADIFLGWLMCLGHRTEFRVFEAFRGKHVARNGRHPFDRGYNFFSRAAWSVTDLAYHIAVQVIVALNPSGQLLVIVDATLLHKRGKSVWGLGWFYDPVASTKKRSVLAPGNKWVVLGLAVRLPGTNKYCCLPLHARLQVPGKGKPSEADLARRLLDEVAQWFPERELLLVGDGAYSAKNLLKGLNARVQYVGLMRKDAELYELPPLASERQAKAGRRPKKGPRLPAPHKVAKQADRARSASSRWQWTTIQVDAYGQKRQFQIVALQALWPKVLGDRPLQVVVVRSLDKGFGEVYYFTTDLAAQPAWVVATYAKRTWIEAMFKGSKQVMDIQRPRHFCRQSVERLAPWVWLMQSLVALWYLTEGRKLPEAKAARKDLGSWETEWSLQHMLRVLRRLTIRQTFEQMSQQTADLREIIDQAENYLFLAA